MIEQNVVVFWSSNHDTIRSRQMCHDQVTFHKVDEQGVMQLQESNQRHTVGIH